MESGERTQVFDRWDLSVLLRDLPGIAWRGKLYIIFSLLLTLGLGVSYLLQTTPIYNVGARVLVERHNMPLQQDQRASPGAKFLGTQAEIIDSPAVVRAALETVPSTAFVGTEQERLRLVLKSLSVTPVDGTDVLALSLWNSDPEEGVPVLAAMIESYRAFVRDTDHAEVQALRILERKEKELRDKLSVLETRYEEFRIQNALATANDVSLGASKSILNRVEAQLVEAKSRRLALEGRIAAEKGAIGKRVTIDFEDAEAKREAFERGRPPSGFEADSRGVEEELWQAKMHMAALSQRYGDSHPDVLEARQQVAMWEDRLAASIGVELQELERELAAARSTERELSELYSRGLEERTILDETERVRAMHERMLDKLKQTELTLEAVTELQGGIVVRTLEAPGLRVEKVWPNPVLVLGPSALVGLVGGLLLATIVDRSRARPR